MKDIVVSSEIVVSLLALTGITITGGVTILVAVLRVLTHARAANDAVNNRHIKPTELGLYDMTREMHVHKGAMEATVEMMTKQLAKLIKDQARGDALHQEVHAQIQKDLLVAHEGIKKIAESCQKQ